MTATDQDVATRVARVAPLARTADRFSPGIGSTANADDLRARAAASAGDPLARVLPIAPRRRRTRRALIGLTAAAALALVAGGVTTVLPSDAPLSPQSAVADEIERLSVKAAASPLQEIGPGQYLHVRFTETITQSTDSDDGATPVVDELVTERESWIMRDGTRYSVSSDPYRGEGVHSGPQRVDDPTPNDPSPEYLDTLPTDPVELNRYLEDFYAVRGGGDPQVITLAVMDLLRTEFAAPALRSAVFEVLRMRLDGSVSIEHDVVLPSGRTGVGLRYRYGDPGADRFAEDRTLVFDPESGALIGSRGTAEWANRGTAGDGTPAESRTTGEQWSERTVLGIVDSVPPEVLAGT